MATSRDLADALLEVVRQRMAEHQLSGRALAARIGLSPVTTAAHLRGEGTIGVDEWEAIAQALGARDLEELLEEARRQT